MMIWCIFTSAALVAARRSVLGSVAEHSAERVADSRSRVAVQVFTASLAPDSAGHEELCFRVVESFMCRHYGERNQFAELKAGDLQCLKPSDQSAEVQVALQNLVTGDMVKLRKSTDFVVRVMDHAGSQTKEGTITEQVTVLRAGNEVSRKPETIQKVTATYISGRMNGNSKMLVNHGVEASTELACFKVQKSWGYSTNTDSKNTGSMMKNGDELCISPDDQNTEARDVIDKLGVGKSVMINLVKERVMLSTASTEWEHSVTLVEGAVLTTEKRAAQQASGTVASIGNGRFCFNVVTTREYKKIESDAPRTHDGRTLCFDMDLQNVREQSTLSTLKTSSTLELFWTFDWVSYDGNGVNTMTSTGEPIIEKIEMFGQQWEQVSTDLKTIQKMTATSMGTEKPYVVVSMIVNREGTPADVACFKFEQSLGFEALSESDYKQIQSDTVFCVDVGVQNTHVQNTIHSLESGAKTTMIWLNELVSYKTTAKDGTNWMTTQPQETFIVTQGIETIDPLSAVQEATLNFVGPDDSSSDGMKYCFSVVEMQKTHIGQGSIGHTIINTGDTVCFFVSVQTAQVVAKLMTLPAKTVVEMHWGSAWVAHDGHGSTTSTSTNEFVISKIVVPTQLQKQEYLRTPKVVQKFTATYQGSTKTSAAKMFNDLGVETPVELACFILKASKSFATANINWKDEKMQPGDEFCINPYDQSPPDRITILSLETDALVTVNWVHEIVEFEIWANSRDGWKQTFESKHSFMVHKGSERQSTENTRQEGTAKFDEPTLTAEGSREFCFKLLTNGWYTQVNSEFGNAEIPVGDKFCFALDVQNAEIQTKLLALPQDSTVTLRWAFVEFYHYNAENVATDVDQTVEPIVLEIHRAD